LATRKSRIIKLGTGRRKGSASGYARVTLPAFRHDVQTVIRRRFPGATSARTRCTFGFHRRWVRRWECETDMPKPGPLPQMSQTLATWPPCDMNVYRE
jgi:hypothetical protein